MITQTTVTNDDEDEGGNGGEVQDCTHNWVEIGRTQYIITYQCSICSATYEEPIQQQEEFSLRSATVTTERHDYIYASGQLLREVITTTDAEGNVTTETLDFTYDTNGSPYTVTRIVGTTSSTYYYVVNLQGDVIRLLSGTGATVAEYEYDPYGRVLSASGTIAEVNPLRYRGYYYDAEMEFYYLQSRYYDPVICRFVNADRYASTGQGFLGQNMFAYCLNNPVIGSDPTGEIVITATVVGIAAMAVVDALIAGFFAYLETESFWDATWAAVGALFRFGLSMCFPCLDIYIIIYDAVKTLCECIDSGMSRETSLVMTALQVLVSLLPGYSTDELLDVLIDVMICEGKITFEAIRAAAIRTAEEARESANPNPGNIPSGKISATAAAAGGGGHSCMHPGRVTIFC